MGLVLLSVALLALLVWPAQAVAAQDPDVLCGACRALMDEVEYDVTKAQQKKTKVGSFRINPDGTQEQRKDKGNTDLYVVSSDQGSEDHHRDLGQPPLPWSEVERLLRGSTF